VHTSAPHNYTEVNPPILVRDTTMFGTAQLPKFRADQFSAVREHDLSQQLDISQLEIEARKVKPGSGDMESKLTPLETPVRRDTLWLIPTAEVPLTNLVRESILDEDALPMHFTACTPCFRAEAGAAGKDTRGMIRQHQFTKVELVSITTPEQSKDEHERFLQVCPSVERYIVDTGIQLIKFWLEVGNEEQKRRFEARIEDPLRQWKLSAMDLPSRSKWYAYSRARDQMLAATDTQHAPWHIVRSDDKRRARLNLIAHLLSLIPYEEVRREKVELPKRSKKEAYDDIASIANRRFVPEKY